MRVNCGKEFQKGVRHCLPKNLCGHWRLLESKKGAPDFSLYKRFFSATDKFFREIFGQPRAYFVAGDDIRGTLGEESCFRKGAVILRLVWPKMAVSCRLRVGSLELIGNEDQLFLPSPHLCLHNGKKRSRLKDSPPVEMCALSHQVFPHFPMIFAQFSAIFFGWASDIPLPRIFLGG